jgi:predicted MFS family arabinose efflux permease
MYFEPGGVSFWDYARQRETLGQDGVRSRYWLAVLIGSTIGGFVPALWGGELLSYAGVLFSGIGAVLGLWIADRTR